MMDCRMDIAYIDPETYSSIVNHDLRKDILRALYTMAAYRPVTKAQLAERLGIKYQQLVYQLTNHLSEFWRVDGTEKVRGAHKEYISPAIQGGVFISIGRGGRVFVVDPLSDRFGPIEDVGLRCDECSEDESERCMLHVREGVLSDTDIDDAEVNLLLRNGRREPYRPLDMGIVRSLRGVSRGDSCVIRIPCDSCAFMAKHLIAPMIGEGMSGSSTPTRFVVLGGFLGSGKTTLAVSLARVMKERFDKSVAIITNDQGDVLVDTEFTRDAGFDVKEVLGGCFCANFSDFVKSARSLVSMGRPDVIIAEPIGTSTNLLASVITPLRSMYPDEFQVAPFTIVVDGTRARDIIEHRDMGEVGVEMIPAHQVKEAEYIILSKVDRLDRKETDRISEELGTMVPDARLIPYSSLDLRNVDSIVKMILSDEVSQKGAVGDENSLFASEKAKLGWFSSTWRLTPESRVDIHRLMISIMKNVSAEYDPESIAHVKIQLSSEETAIKMSLVYDSVQIDAIKGTRYIELPATIVLNARVVSPPNRLQDVMHESIHSLEGPLGFELSSVSESCFTPKPEAPSHFFTE